MKKSFEFKPQHKLVYKIVLTPHYSKSLLNADVVKMLPALFNKLAQASKWQIHELEILPDHVSIVLQLPPSISLQKAV